MDKSKCYKKGGRKQNSINTFNSYIYKDKFYRTISCIQLDLQISRKAVYKMINNSEILKIKTNF